MRSQQLEQTITANLDAIGLQAFIDHAMKLPCADSGLTATDLFNGIQNQLIPDFELKGLIRLLVIRLARSINRFTQPRQRIFQPFFLDFEVRASDAVKPKVFFTSIL